jgi:hypothetical protein
MSKTAEQLVFFLLNVTEHLNSIWSTTEKVGVNKTFAHPLPPCANTGKVYFMQEGAKTKRERER